MAQDNVTMPKIALGAWAWGNDGTFGNMLTEDGLRPVFDAAMQEGLNLWDTAYVYGMGTSETMGKIEKLNAGLRKMADRHNVSVAQIPVAWAVAKGTLPIIGVTKTEHVEDAVKAVNVVLSPEKITELETLADEADANVIRMWEKEMK